MKIDLLLKNAQHVVRDNSPAILTALGVTGTVSTAVLTARAAFRVGMDVNAGHYEPLLEGLEPEVYDSKALVKTYWKEFIPPVAVGATTIACVLGANHVSSRRTAAFATAYSLAEKAFGDYKETVIEQIGHVKEQKIRDEVAQKVVTEKPASTAEVIITGNGDVLCMDLFSGRYFKSTVEKLRRAENDINSAILSDMYCSLNEFWNEIGLSSTGMGEELGFSIDNRVDLQFSAVMSEDNTPCIGVGFGKLPKKDYHKIF